MIVGASSNLQAGQLVQADVDVLTQTELIQVASAMTHLLETNHGQQQKIEKLRKHLVHVLYEKGFCASVHVHHDNHICDVCRGTGYDFRYACPICTGSGIRHVEELYRFSFNIFGHYYQWDVPLADVTFPVKVSQFIGPVQVTPRQPLMLSEKSGTEFNERIIYTYLRHSGISIWQLPFRYLLQSLMKHRGQSEF